MEISGVPALVIDGGTAMTYTGVDVDGNILGGGISPGRKFRKSSVLCKVFYLILFHFLSNPFLLRFRTP